MFIALSKDLAIVLRKGLVVESLSAVVETVELFFSIGLRLTLGGFQSVVLGFGLTAPSTRDGISTGIC
mgnify:CR=1 FL=1